MAKFATTLEGKKAIILDEKANTFEAWIRKLEDNGWRRMHKDPVGTELDLRQAGVTLTIQKHFIMGVTLYSHGIKGDEVLDRIGHHLGIKA